MSTASDFKPRSLTASEYVLNLFGPAENVAVVVRNRASGRTIQNLFLPIAEFGVSYEESMVPERGLEPPLPCEN